MREMPVKKFQWDRPTTSVRELEKGPCGNRVWERESGRKEKEKTIVSNDERHKNIGDDLEWMRRVVALDVVVALGVVAVVGRRVKRRSNKISLSARTLFKKICLPQPFFIYFHLFKQTLQQVHVKKMSIKYTVLGFEPTTFRSWVSSNNH